MAGSPVIRFADMRNIEEENLRTYFDDHLWIYMHRQKTGVQSNSRLLDIPLQIIEKYRGLDENGKELSVPAYMNCLYGINAAAKRCGINKRLAWHHSLHTMAIEICLTNNVPIETVSSNLGHKRIKKTQIYVKITKKKLNRDIENLSDQLKNIQEYSSAAI